MTAKKTQALSGNSTHTHKWRSQRGRAGGLMKREKERKIKERAHTKLTDRQA